MLLKSNVTYLAGIVLVAMGLSGCSSNGEQYAANTFQSGQVNTRQETKTVNILMVSTANVTIDNAKEKKAAQTFGAIIGAVGGAVLGHNVGSGSNTNSAVGAVGGGAAGALAGSAVGATKTVKGVLITYVDGGKTFSSAEVGQPCEFTKGLAVMTSTGANETRIQPNATCPVTNKA
jgi:outer membrane lipoprotein SlyB